MRPYEVKGDNHCLENINVSSEYDQEASQTYTAEEGTRITDSHNTIKVKQRALQLQATYT